MKIKDLTDKIKNKININKSQTQDIGSSFRVKLDFKKIINNIKEIPTKIKNFNLKEFIKYCKENKVKVLSCLVLFFFFITILTVTLGMNSIFGKQQSKIRFIEENGIKFIGIKNGFITEKLVVETGEEIPEIKEYFDEDYKLDDNASISYFNGETKLSLEEFTFQKNNKTYLRGYQTIDVVITNDGESYSTTLVINDTKPPSITLQELTIFQGETVSAESFVSVFIDNSQITDFSSTIIGSVDYSSIGTYDVTISVCDKANNCTDGSTKLNVKKQETSSSNKGGVGDSKDSEVTVDKNNQNNDKNDKNKDDKNKDDKNNNSGSSDSGENKKDPVNQQPAKRVYVGTKVANDYPIKTIDHFGAKEIIYDKQVTYDYYSDGYIVIKKTSGKTYTKWDHSGYKADINAMKTVAKNDLKNLSTFIDTFKGLINSERKAKSVNTLEANYTLSIMAQVRAMEILYGDKVSHTRPNNTNWDTMLPYFVDMSKTAKYAETLSFGHTSDQSAFNALVNSTDHYNTMIDKKYTKVGLGRFSLNGYTVWVQIFSS